MTETDTKHIEAADLARFIAERTYHNLFLSGKAGTGKTSFLKDFVSNTKKKVVVLAPTGIAAINAGAVTIHSFFRFSPAPNPGGKVRWGFDMALDDDEEELLRNVDLIIIDEISMVRADVLDHISEKIRLIRNSDKPFGGVQLFMIGDLLQLPPVVSKEDEEVLKEYYGANYYFFNSNALRTVGFETICLDKVYRQDNKDFVRILNKAREGKITWGDCAKLNARFLPDFEPHAETQYITLVSQRKQAEQINNANLDRLEGDTKCYTAVITGDFPDDLQPTPKSLYLKIGSQVMFTKNNKEVGYYNGALGEVASMDEDSISVKVGDRIIKVEEAKWENVGYEYDIDEDKIRRTTVGTFKQFPLKPAWAITIHKSQGLTFENVIIDIPHAFAAGQTYVALSRCRSLDGLILKHKIYPNYFFLDSLLSRFYEGVDNAEHLTRLAEAVNYSSLSGENDKVSTCGQFVQIADDSAGAKHLKEIVEIINAVENQLTLYLETGSELDEEFSDLFNEATRIIGGNVYYQIKLSSVIDSWEWWFKKSITKYK